MQHQPDGPEGEAGDAAGRDPQEHTGPATASHAHVGPPDSPEHGASEPGKARDAYVPSEGNTRAQVRGWGAELKRGHPLPKWAIGLVAAAVALGVLFLGIAIGGNGTNKTSATTGPPTTSAGYTYSGDLPPAAGAKDPVDQGYGLMEDGSTITKRDVEYLARLHQSGIDSSSKADAVSTAHTACLGFVRGYSYSYALRALTSSMSSGTQARAAIVIRSAVQTYCEQFSSLLPR